MSKTMKTVNHQETLKLRFQGLNMIIKHCFQVEEVMPS